MKAGDRVQLKYLNKPIGTIQDVIDGTKINDVTFVQLTYCVLWDDGCIGERVPHNELELISQQLTDDESPPA